MPGALERGRRGVGGHRDGRRLGPAARRRPSRPGRRSPRRKSPPRPNRRIKAKPKVEAPKIETLHYTGKVKEIGTGKPIAGATVVVRRSILKRNNENTILQETRHTTDADGAYSFTIPPEQVAERYLYIELDVEHPDYATQAGFGYGLALIRSQLFRPAAKRVPFRQP